MLRFDDFLRFLFLSLNYYHLISWLPPNELSWVTGSLGPPAQQKTKQIFDFWKIREKLNLTGKYCVFVNKIQNRKKIVKWPRLSLILPLTIVFCRIFLTKIDLFQELNQDEVFQDFAAQGQPGQDYSLDMSSASGQIY